MHSLSVPFEFGIKVFFMLSLALMLVIHKFSQMFSIGSGVLFLQTALHKNFAKYQFHDIYCNIDGPWLLYHLVSDGFAFLTLYKPDIDVVA